MAKDVAVLKSWSAVCTRGDGWEGPPRKTYQEAAGDREAHLDLHRRLYRDAGRAACQVCGTPIRRTDNSRPGGRWAHDAPPADDHPAQYYPCDDHIPCSGCGSEHRDTP